MNSWRKADVPRKSDDHPGLLRWTHIVVGWVDRRDRDQQIDKVNFHFEGNRYIMIMNKVATHGLIRGKVVCKQGEGLCPNPWATCVPKPCSQTIFC